MKKIILLNFCNGLYGGIESFLLNAFYCLDKNKYDVTFLTCGKSTYEMFREDIESKGGHVEEIPILAKDYNSKRALYGALKLYFKNSKPDIVHINSGTLSLHLLASKAAKKEKVPKVILHSHNFLPNKTGVKEKIKGILKKQLIRNADSFLACSTGAAKWIYPQELIDEKKVIIIPNGVDTAKFLYDSKKRDAFRKEFNINNELLIGNIGRFQGQKNHVFMIEIMKEVVKINPNAKLMFAGEGILKNDIIEMTDSYGLNNNIVFLGERKDMDAFLSAIDVFILPSLYEGLPIAAIEAQASGAKVLLSEKITKETNVTGDAKYLSIDRDVDAKNWADEICSGISDIDRKQENKKVYDAGFDVHTCYKKMIDIYEEVFRNADN